MKLKNLLTINAISALVYGLDELLIPEAMFSIYGVTHSPGRESLSAILWPYAHRHWPADIVR